MRFEVLGPLVAISHGEPIALRPAQRRLLASLLVTPGVALPLDTLIDQMWNESPPRTALQAIHVHLSALRRGLPGVVQVRDGGYVADLEHHELDVVEFSTLAAGAAERLVQGGFRDASEMAAAAGRLWRGGPYPELADVEAARGERDRLTELWLTTRTTEARALALQGRVSESIGALRQLVAEEPLNENLWEELVLAYCMTGRRADALAAVESARAVLHRELAATLGPRLSELEQRVMHHDPALVDRAATSVAHNLPLLDSSFIGRDSDMSAVAGLVSGHHLTAITGPPGIGKTRLAIEVAARMLDTYAAGAWLVRLAGARTAADVLSTLSSAMAVADQVDDLGQLYRILAPRPALLILDNAEHVLDPVREFLANRLYGDRLRVLATSRSSLGVSEEAGYSLRPISLPASTQTMWESATLLLLADRVADADPRIALTGTEPDVLLELCRRTGGMPLAVELVARRVVSLDLHRASSLPFAGVLDTSVSGAIARSVALLDAADRRRFVAASVFAATFTAEAFERVCVERRNERIADDTIRRLCEASLLVPEHATDNAVRYRMLEPIRDFAHDRLSSSRATAARDRHAEWFVDAARRTASASWTDAEAQALDEAEASLADYREAMRHLLDTDRPHLAADIAAGLVQFWISRFLAREGQRWLDECLAFEMDDERRTHILAAASGVAFFVGRYDESEALSKQVLEMAVRRGDRHLEAQALYGWGRVQIHRRPKEGHALMRRAIAAYESIGDRVAAAECRVVIGMQAAYAADRVTADAILTEATELLEQEGYPRIASVGRRHLSMAAWHEDDEPAARRHADAALALAERANDRRVRSGTLSQAGMVEAKWGEPAVAAALLVESLQLVAGQQGMYFSLVAFGALELLCARREWSMAAQLLAHFDEVHREFGWIPLDRRNAAAPRYRAQVRAGLASNGGPHDIHPVPTPVIAERLIATLKAIEREPGAVAPVRSA